MNFIIINELTEQIEGGGFVPLDRMETTSIHVPDGCRLDWKVASNQ